MPSILDSIDSELLNLDSELAELAALDAPAARLHFLARLDWSPETSAAIAAAIEDHTSARQAREAARTALEAAAVALREARRAVAASAATPAPRERLVSPLVAAELAAAAAAVRGAVSLFRAVRTNGVAAIAEGQA